MTLTQPGSASEPKLDSTLGETPSSPAPGAPPFSVLRGRPVRSGRHSRRRRSAIPAQSANWEHLIGLPCGFVNDPRDLPFIRLSVTATLTLVPIAVLLYVPGFFRWWLGLAYFALNFFLFFDRYILMLHNTSHRVLFKKRYAVLNRYIPWVLGPLFGESPDTYYAHHMGMHHPEGNLKKDLSSTMPYRRDSFGHFMAYFLRFFLAIYFELSRYLFRERRLKLLRRMWIGEGTYLLAVICLAFVNWRATLCVFIIPLCVARFLMMAGNWGQHAFVDPNDAANDYRNSITCVNGRYNRRCFNDGYHIGHHVKPNRHWTELPGDFLTNKEEYARQGAIIFHTIDFFVVWLFLMLKRYDWLARFYVEIDGQNRSKDEVMALLRSRTAPIPT